MRLVVAMHSYKLSITGPCPIDLDATDFDRTKKLSACSHCNKNVHNLSNLTESEARALLARLAGSRVCVSYARRADGTIRFRPELGAQSPAQIVPTARLRARGPAQSAAKALAGVGLAASLAACAAHGPPPRIDDTGTQMAPNAPEHGLQIPKVEPEVPVAGEMPVHEQFLDGEVAPPPDEMVEGGMVAEPAGEIDLVGDVALEPEPARKPKATPKPAPKHLAGRVAIPRRPPPARGEVQLPRSISNE